MASAVKVYARWTREDKLKLLHGLRKYGHRDIQKISKFIPNKSPSAIRTMIYKYSAIAKEIDKTEEPLTEWLELSNLKDDNSMVSEALLYILTNEQQPPPEEAGGINLSVLYELLYRASTSHPLPDLTQTDIEALSNLNQVLQLRMNPSTEGDVLKYLHSFNNDYSQGPNNKVYSKKKE